MPDVTPIEAGAPEPPPGVLRRIAWFRSHREIFLVVALLLIGFVTVVDMLAPDGWLFEAFYLVPLGLLVLSYRDWRVVAVIGVVCGAGAIVMAASQGELRGAGDVTVFVLYGLGVALFVELAVVLDEAVAVSDRATRRARLAAADAAIIALSTTGLPVRELMDEALQRVATELAAVAAILDLDGDQWTVVAASGLGVEIRDARLPLEAMPLSMTVVESGGVMRVDDATTALRDIGRPNADAIAGLDIEHAIGVPMRVLGRGVGVLLIGRGRERGDFGADETAFLTGVAGHVAAAAESVRLVSDLETRERRLSLVIDSSLDFAASLDPKQVVEAVVTRLVEALGVKACDVHVVLEPERVAVRTVVSFDDGALDTSDFVGKTYSLADMTSTAHVVATGHPLVITSLDDPLLSERERELMRRYGQQSQFSLPLRSKDRIIGVAELFDKNAGRDYGPDEVELAEALCQFAALALENAQLHDRSEHRNATLHELVEISREVTTARDVDQLLRTLARRLLELLDVADCDMFTLAGDALFSKVSYDRDGYDDSATGHRLRLDDFPTSREVVETQAVVLTTPEKVALLESEDERAVYADWGFVCGISVPMLVDGGVHGIIDIYDDHERDFTDDVDFLTTVGQLAAAALQKQQLIEQVTERNEVLRELVDLGAVIWRARDIGSLMRQVCTRLTAATGVRCCEVFRQDRNGVLRCAVSYHSEEGFDDSEVGRAMPLLDYPATAAAIDRRETLVVASLDDQRLTDRDRKVYARGGFESELCLPLVIEDRVVGLLDLFDVRPRDFAEVLDFIATAGQMVAGAFENVGLVERLNETNRELTALVDSSLEFGSSLDLDRVLIAIASRIREVADAACCDIYQIEEGTTVIGLASVDRRGVSPDFAGRRWDAALYSVGAMVAGASEPMIIADRDKSPLVTPAERDEWKEYGYRSCLRLPLMSRGELRGWISVFDDRVREFGHLGFFRGLTQIAAQAVVNAMLYQELNAGEKRLRQVNEASIDLSSTLSLETVLYSTAERLCQIGGVPCCDIYTLDEETQTLTCVASVKDGDVSLAWVGHTAQLGDWAMDSRAIGSRATVIVTSSDDPTIADEERALLKATGFESQLTVPLFSSDRVLGSVQLLDRRPGRVFPQATVDTVEAICRAAALAIGNAQLFAIERATLGRLELLAEQLRGLQDISLHLNRMRGEEAVLEQVVRGGADLLRVDCAAYVVRDAEVVQLKAFHGAAEDAGTDEAVAAVLDTMRRIMPRIGDVIEPAGVEAAVEQRALVCDGALVVPLRRQRSDAVAALVFNGKAGGAEFDAEDLRLATTLAAQLSATLRNVKAYQREHEIAEEFQNALLESPPVIDGGDFGVRYVPAGQAARVGGDFYDFVRLGPQRVMVAIGDVCGRGLTAAVQTAMVRYMLRAYAAESSPGESLARLNATITAQAPDLPFLTMLVAYIDIERRSFDYAVAGHPRPMVFAGERLGIAEDGGFPIGVFPNSVYPTNRMVLPESPTIVLYTDGLTESRREASLLREDRAARMVARHQWRSAQAIADTLVSRARRFGGMSLDDDMAVVVVKLD